MIRVAAPHEAAYKVFTVSERETWEWTPADLLCHTSTSDDASAADFSACELYIRANVPAQGFTFIKVERCEPGEHGAAVPAKKKQMFEWSIRNEVYEVEYEG